MTQTERIAAAKTWYQKHVAERAELEATLAESSDALRTVANLFSASVWKILPTQIKAYFDDYREA